VVELLLLGITDRWWRNQQLADKLLQEVDQQWAERDVSPDLVSKLIGGLRSDHQATATCAELLGRIGDPSALPALREVQREYKWKTLEAAINDIERRVVTRRNAGAV